MFDEYLAGNSYDIHSKFYVAQSPNEEHQVKDAPPHIKVGAKVHVTSTECVLCCTGMIAWHF